ncbi:MAG: hypothetical protein KGL39_34380 [Patescibacteria group bacterium]|nr:hypothetical protein [Patescibacteria group bacterium]
MAEMLADRLKRLLEERGLTEADAASAMRTAVYKVARLLDGTTKSLKLDEALRLCEKTGIDPFELGLGRARRLDASSDAGTEERSLVDRRRVANQWMEKAQALMESTRKTAETALKSSQEALKVGRQTAADVKRLAEQLRKRRAS